MKKSQKPIPDYLSDFLDWVDIEKGLGSKTQENYSRFLNKFINWLKESGLQNLKPHQLTPDHIWNYRAYLARQYSSKDKQKLKRSTQNYYLIALRALLNFFAERNIQSLPAEKITLAKEKDTRDINFLSVEQVEKLLQTPDTEKIQGLRDRSLLEMLFSTGMRVSELVSLNKKQINIKKDTKDLELVIKGKGDRIRTVYLSERCVGWLDKYLKSRKDDSPALFINYRRKKGASSRLSARAIQKKIKRYAVQAGVPTNITPHSIRHSFSTDLLSKGVDLRVLQEFLGHKNIAATQIYTHVTSKQLRDIHRKYHGGRDSS